MNFLNKSFNTKKGRAIIFLVALPIAIVLMEYINSFLPLIVWIILMLVTLAPQELKKLYESLFIKEGHEEKDTDKEKTND